MTTTATPTTDLSSTRLSNARTSSTPNLLRLAGLAGVLAGVCYVLVGIFHPTNQLASVTSTRWETVHVLACAMSFFGVLGVTGLYARQAAKSRWFGLLGFLVFSLWLVLIMGFSFVEAFILPHLASSNPAFVEGWMGMFNGTAAKVPMGALPTLWTLTAPLYIGGGALFAIATFRAGILPRAAAVLLAVGTVMAPVAVLLPLAAQPKTAIPVGVALAWLGYALLTERNSSLPDL
jgi:hypothetical protein